jgi:hypothetical protein
MKKIMIFLKTTFVISILFGSFSGTVLIAEKYTSITDICYGFFIDIESANNVVNLKINDCCGSNVYSIDKTTEVFSNNEILFYIANLDPKGYVIVSAYSNLPPVIAYSFTDNFFSDSGNENHFLDILKTDIDLRLASIKYLPKTTINERNQVWKKCLSQGKEISTKLEFQQWPPSGTTKTGGWLETKWSQGSPYNDFCPMDYKNDKRSVAGCPAVAMAQILNYHKTTNNIVFDDNDDYTHNFYSRFTIDDDYLEYDFPSFSKLNTYLDNLSFHYQNKISINSEDKAALNFACGIAAEQVYSGSVSGTWGVNQAHDAYLRFGCDSIQLLDDNDPEVYDVLADNMKNALPAHLALVTPDWQSGHNLVVDGYNTDGYFHLNFGWGGQYNGWYLLPDQVPYGLTVLEGLIVDIFKNKAGSNLECYGSLNFVNVTAGNTLQDSFVIENIGEPGSLLSWEIASYPEWGNWSFSPTNGTGLTPEQGPTTVEVSITAPNKKNQVFDGGIKLVNKQAEGDCCYIPVTLKTPKTKVQENSILYFLWLLYDLFEIIDLILSNK